MNILSKTLSFGLALTLLACGQENSSQITQEQQKTGAVDTEKVIVAADRVLNLEIDGMVCKMGCGGAIRKELYGTSAVSDVDFDFSEDRSTNYAKVYFDKDKIDADKILELITRINEGQFTVRTTGSEAYTAENELTEDICKSSSEEPKVKAITTNLEVPNLFELITQYLI